MPAQLSALSETELWREFLAVQHEAGELEERVRALDNAAARRLDKVFSGSAWALGEGAVAITGLVFIGSAPLVAIGAAACGIGLFVFKTGREWGNDVVELLVANDQRITLQRQIDRLHHANAALRVEIGRRAAAGTWQR